MRPRTFAKGARKTIKRPGEMNRLEASYAAHLEGLKLSKAILDFGYEPLKLRLADKTFYSPDFMVLALDGTLELHEVKAYWKTKAAPHIEAAASIKMKLASESFPFKFVLVWKIKDAGWQSRAF